ncbi:MAG: tyrosine-protein phosphatase [Victivallales bacterium]|nr:tyrosine-protein phosphatase [Victivallales bacterium]
MSQRSRFSLPSLILCAFLALPAQAAFQIIRPSNGATVSSLKPMQRALAMMTEEQLDVFLTQEMVERMADVTTYPAGVDVEWEAADQAPGGYVVRVADNAEMDGARNRIVQDDSITLFNLEIGKTYYLQVGALGEANADGESEVLQTTAMHSFTVENLAPRVMNVPGVPNVRDLGGRVGLEGRVIPQGMIFRSAAFNDNSPDGKRKGATRVTEENHSIILHEMKLKTEIDLRWDRELAGMDSSPAGPEVNYISIPSTLYAGLFTQQGYENYQKLFPVFAKAENYPIDFHCILGADRTGSLAVVLLAVLGVSREEIIRDYCFTSLYASFLRPPRNIRSVLDGLAQCGQPGDTLSDQAMRFLLRCGVRSGEIYDFLTIVLGEGLAMPKVLAEARITEEIHDHFSQPLQGLSVKPYIVRRETMLQAGKEVSWELPVWQESLLVASGSNGQGAGYLLLRNATPATTTVALEADRAVLTASGYFVVAPMRRLSYRAPDGNLPWTPEQLNDFHIVLEPSEELLLVVQPSAMLDADSYQIVRWQELSFTPRFAEVPAAPAPAVDGLLDDATWQGLAPLAMTNIDGTGADNAPLVWLRTNDAHDTLYLAAKLQDATPCAEAHAERDASLWNEDSIEIFLSSHGEAMTYQLILNAGNAIWDGISGDNGGGWTAECQFKSAKTADGWTIEAVIPLAQFDFAGALELNVCANDNPDGVHYNLFLTQGNFHSRAALSPVLWK